MDGLLVSGWLSMMLSKSPSVSLHSQPPCSEVGSHDTGWPMSCGWEGCAPLPGQSMEEPEQFSSYPSTCPMTEEVLC